MSNKIENKIEDLSWEHSQHNTFQENCPICYFENRLLKAKKIVTSDMTHEELVEDRGGHYEGSPIGGWI